VNDNLKGDEVVAGIKQTEDTSDVAKVDTKKTVAKEPNVPKAASGSSSVVAWLALLLVLAIAGAGVWGVTELQRREQGLMARMANLESSAAAENAQYEDMAQRVESRLAAESSKHASSAAATSATNSQLEALDTRLSSHAEELARLGATDKQDWLLAEAQYLLRLANQRLIMADDLVAAKALLSSADQILLDLEDVSLHAVRAAVAADLASIRAVPARDIQGMYLALAALIEQTDGLVIYEMPIIESPEVLPPADTWQGRLQQGYQTALQKISNYIVIERRDVPLGALMEPQWEGLVRQNLRMLLEQAQVALLSGNEVLFKESLQRAQYWLEQLFQADNAAVQALSQEISALESRKISVQIPDISRSLVALDAALDKRRQAAGGE
jgi:uroporphyrin-3 C-methyltransferase